jgi:hypothetical protein
MTLSGGLGLARAANVAPIRSVLATVVGSVGINPADSTGSAGRCPWWRTDGTCGGEAFRCNRTRGITVTAPRAAGSNPADGTCSAGDSPGRRTNGTECTGIGAPGHTGGVGA